MTWFEKLMPSRIKTERKTRSVPEGIWIKCPECGAQLYRAELERNLYVCPKCDHHMRLSARSRLEVFLDPDSGREIAERLVPQDPLRFRDSKRYRDRIAQAQKDTGENDALVAMTGLLKGLPVEPAVTAEVKRLRQQEKVDLVVVLAAVPYDEALRVAEKVEGVDFVVQSHDGRGLGMAQRQSFATMIPPGDRGRQLAKLELSLDGPGRFTDISEKNRAQQNLGLVENNLAKAKEKLAAEQDPARKASYQQAVASLEARREALKKVAGGSATGAARTHLLSYIQLGNDVPADPAVQKLVERIEPPGSAAH